MSRTTEVTTTIKDGIVTITIPLAEMIKEQVGHIAKSEAPKNWVLHTLSEKLPAPYSAVKINGNVLVNLKDWHDWSAIQAIGTACTLPQNNVPVNVNSMVGIANHLPSSDNSRIDGLEHNITALTVTMQSMMEVLATLASKPARAKKATASPTP